MKTLRDLYQTLWKRTTPGRRVAYACIVGGLILSSLAFYMQQPGSDSVLFSNLTLEDSGAVAASLSSQNIPYALSGGGSTILVRSKDVDSARIALASLGLPRSSGLGGNGNGYTLLDSSQLGQTADQQKANALRALQGELEKTISKMDGVSGARVFIAADSSGLYKTDAAPATASVMLKVNGNPLTDSQVRTIAHLVSSAVPKLKPEQITITDTLATDYTAALTDAKSGGGSAQQLSVKHDYESSLARRVNGFLNPVIGPGKAVVQVTADLDWTQLETTTTVIDENPVLQTKTEHTETFAGPSTASTSGVAGSGSNLPGSGGATASAKPGSSQNYGNTTTTVTNALGSTVSKTTKAPGSVKKQFVSVLVDTAPNDPQLAAVLDAVKAASGFDQARGDIISVVGRPFDRKAATDAAAAITAAQASADSAKQFQLIAASALVAAVVVFIFIQLRGRKKAALVAEGGPFPFPSSLEPEPTGERADLRRAEDTHRRRQTELNVTARTERAKMFEKAANENPRMFADVLRTIMREADKGGE